MSLNEIAALLINWEPGKVCPVNRVNPKYKIIAQEYCKDQRFWGKYGDPDDGDHRDGHLIPAPDMNSPDNYMAAVHLLTKLYGAIQITLTSKSIHISTPGFAHEGMGNSWTEALANLKHSIDNK